ncbi:hypothetical protein CDAR_605371 [Caerostris darwini]|uniref:Uncharacterized protein n=1 Tax=Caerostris darwini TaxID=1538125 RepID=A0AAV4QXB9_9ARAC|nr:hypothetical protein CDAR_605371 [Caerostris darwini]
MSLQGVRLKSNSAGSFNSANSAKHVPLTVAPLDIRSRQTHCSILMLLQNMGKNVPTDMEPLTNFYSSKFSLEYLLPLRSAPAVALGGQDPGVFKACRCDPTSRRWLKFLRVLLQRQGMG